MTTSSVHFVSTTPTPNDNAPQSQPITKKKNAKLQLLRELKSKGLFFETLTKCHEFLQKQSNLKPRTIERIKRIQDNCRPLVDLIEKAKAAILIQNYTAAENAVKQLLEQHPNHEQGISLLAEIQKNRQVLPDLALQLQQIREQQAQLEKQMLEMERGIRQESQNLRRRKIVNEQTRESPRTIEKTQLEQDMNHTDKRVRPSTIDLAQSNIDQAHVAEQEKDRIKKKIKWDFCNGSFYQAYVAANAYKQNFGNDQEIEKLLKQSSEQLFGTKK